MKTKIKWLVLFWPLALLANEDPFVWSYQIDPPSVVSGGEARLGVMFQIPPGHYLYKEKTRLELTEGEGISLGELEYSPAIRKQDPFFGKVVELFEGGAAVQATILVEPEVPPGSREIKVLLRYQGCSDNLCYREMRHEFPIELAVVTAAPERDPGSIVWKLAAAFFGGMITDLTPCILPIIPITLAFIGVRRERKFGRNLLLSSVLVVAMALSYAAIGILGAGLGKTLGFLFQSVPFLFGTSLLYLLFSIALFGWIPFQLPVGIRNRIARWGGQGVPGAVLAGITVGFLAAPCVGPVVASLLLYVAQSGKLGEGFALFLAYGLGMGSLFLVVGSFYHLLAGRLRGGAATLWIKRGLAAALLLPAGYYGWIGIRQLLRRPALVEVTTAGYWIDPAGGDRRSRETGRPLFIDFFASWCLPCLEMERRTFNDPAVGDLLQGRFIPVKVDCTVETEVCREMVKRYGVVGWPTYLVVGPDGRVLARQVGRVLKPADFLKWIEPFWTGP